MTGQPDLIGELRADIERHWQTLLDPQTDQRTWSQAAYALDAAFAELTAVPAFRDALMGTVDGLVG
jgi:hypothetical protein